MRKIISLLSFSLIFLAAAAGGYEVGDKASDFNLKNVDGSFVSMSDYPDAKGFVITFTCNHCPYAQAYEQRIIKLHKEFAPMGYPVIAINPNDSTKSPGDSYSKMKVRAENKNYPFPYLLDDNHKTADKFGATRTPHMYLLEKEQGDYVVRYIGTIDDSPRDPDEVDVRYLADAIKSIDKGNKPEPATTKAIGCTIKR